MTVKIDVERELRKVHRRVERGGDPCRVCRGELLALTTDAALKCYRPQPRNTDRPICFHKKGRGEILRPFCF